MKECLIIDIEKIINDDVKKIVTKLIKANGLVYLVGGALRDAYYNLEVNDYDLEVYNLSFDELKILLVDDIEYINEKFRTFKLNNIEIALPRLEEKVGHNYQDYQLTFNDISPKQAILRRDFTINTLMYNFNNQTIEDYLNAFDDLENKILRLVSIEHFSEDSIRCLRLLKYHSKLDLKIDDETFMQAKEMAKYLKYQPHDLVIRLFKEIISFNYLNLNCFFEILYDFFNFKDDTYIKTSLNCLKTFKQQLNVRDYHILFIILLFFKTNNVTNEESSYKVEHFLKFQPFLINKQKDINLITNLLSDYHLIEAYKDDLKARESLKKKYQNNFNLLKIIAQIDYASKLIKLEIIDYEKRLIWFESNVLIKYME